MGGDSTRIAKASPSRTRETTEQNQLPGSFPNLPSESHPIPEDSQPIGASSSIQHLAPTNADFAIPNWDSIVRSAPVAAELKSEKFPELLFPEDNICVSPSTRAQRTTRSTVPEELSHARDLPKHVRGLIDFYSSTNWTVLSRRHQENSEYPALSLDDDSVKSLAEIVYDQQDALEETDGVGDERGRDFALVFQTIAGTAGPTEIPKSKDTHRKDGSPGSALTPDSSNGPVRKSSIRSSSTSMDLDKAESFSKFLDYKPGQTDLEAETARQIGRHDLFNLFYDPEAPKPTGRREAEDLRPFEECWGFRFTMEPVSLSFAQEPQEPIFVTLSAFDCASRTRLSEDFSVVFEPEANPVNTSNLQLASSADRSRARKAIFNISDPSPSVFLIARFEKTLEGDMSSVGERLVRQAKDFEVQASKEACARLAGYRQPLGWCAVQLFDDQKRLMGAKIAADTLETNQIHLHSADKLCDDDICALALSAAGGKTGTVLPPLKRVKQLPGRFCVRVEVVTPDMHISNCMTPSLVPLRPFVIDPDVGVVRELQEFAPPETSTVNAHLVYVNNLYIYPMTVDLRKAGWLGFRARNIICRMQLVDGEGQIVKNRLFSPTYADHAFCDSVSTPVVYHSQTPTFYTEFKVALPPWVDASHHILFSFNHVACKPTLAPGQQKEHEIAKAFMPLFDRDGYSLVKNSVHQLRVARQLGPKYWKDPQGINWMDNSVPLFTVRTKSMSSMYSQDGAVTEFFRTIDKDVGSMDPKIIRSLAGANPLALIEFSVALLDELLGIVCTCIVEEVTKAAFEALNDVVLRIEREAEQMKRRSPAKVYAKHCFQNRDTWGAAPYQKLLASWIDFMERANVLMKSARDERYQGKECRARVASMFFPFILVVCDWLSELRERSERSMPDISKREGQLISLCFMWILRNSYRSLVIQWIKLDTASRYSSFLEALKYSMESFRFEIESEPPSKEMQYIPEEPLISKKGTRRVYTSTRKGPSGVNSEIAKRLLEDKYRVLASNTVGTTRQSGMIRAGILSVDTTRKSFALPEDSPTTVASTTPMDVEAARRNLLAHISAEAALVSLDAVEVLLKEVDQRDELAEKLLLKLFDVLVFIASGRQSLEVGHIFTEAFPGQIELTTYWFLSDNDARTGFAEVLCL
ncbi:hypothetical protein M427DRAFT_27258 [Gonapodya prolifera JEL478]|uniref:C2 DOCK-type domain-containing protein n=1 Tax=Gonapodya prolifera (strain JEL478) TaxID=1344416 RepID=A0A139AY66_GONPJ|nr:hypothetical protein M427DRAFT_27258 [Gonapodya prolifera JEL478]|eukprot:KXS21644.1 hypothetical protein M427DRAFT_27258 [Gonapodya prolifera JEL478]